MSVFHLLHSPAVTSILYSSIPLSRENIVKQRRYNELQPLFVIWVKNTNVKHTRQIIQYVRLILKRQALSMILLMVFQFSGKALKAHTFGLPPFVTEQHMLSCTVSYLDQLRVQIAPKSQMPGWEVWFTPKDLDFKLLSLGQAQTGKAEFDFFLFFFQIQPRDYKLHKNRRTSRIFTIWGRNFIHQLIPDLHEFELWNTTECDRIVLAFSCLPHFNIHWTLTICKNLR